MYVTPLFWLLIIKSIQGKSGKRGLCRPCHNNVDFYYTFIDSLSQWWVQAAKNRYTSQITTPVLCSHTMDVSVYSVCNIYSRQQLPCIVVVLLSNVSSLGWRLVLPSCISGTLVCPCWGWRCPAGGPSPKRRTERKFSTFAGDWKTYQSKTCPFWRNLSLFPKKRCPKWKQWKQVSHAFLHLQTALYSLTWSYKCNSKSPSSQFSLWGTYLMLFTNFKKLCRYVMQI